MCDDPGRESPHAETARGLVGFARQLDLTKEAALDALVTAVAVELRNAVAAEREACARLAEAQPFYPDTHTRVRQEWVRVRQQWVKDRIAAAVRARGGVP